MARWGGSDILGSCRKGWETKSNVPNLCSCMWHTPACYTHSYTCRFSSAGKMQEDTYACSHIHADATHTCGCKCAAWAQISLETFVHLYCTHIHTPGISVHREMYEYMPIPVCAYVYAHPSRPYLNACKRWAKDVDKEVDALVVTTISPALYIQW